MEDTHTHSKRGDSLRLLPSDERINARRDEQASDDDMNALYAAAMVVTS